MPARRVTMRYTVRGGNTFAKLSLRLRRAEADLEKDLVTALRDSGKDTLAVVRAAWMGVKVTPRAKKPQVRRGRRSLRRKVSSATQLSLLKSGISIRVYGNQVDPRYGHSLVLALDARKRWRHPLFGNRKYWYEQRGEEVFYSTMRAREPVWQKRIDDTLDRTARKIEG